MTLSRICTGPFAQWMFRRGWRGACLPLPLRSSLVLHWWPGKTISLPVFAASVAHEQTHVAQIERMGSLRWTGLYLWGLVRYGYRNSPLEQEAYSAQWRAFERANK